LTVVPIDDDEDRSTSSDFSLPTDVDTPVRYSDIHQAALNRLLVDGEVPLWSAPASSSAAPDHDATAAAAIEVIDEPVPDHPAAGQVPRFVINLDLPAAERWNEVIDRFRPQLVQSDREITRFLHSSVGRIKGGFLESMASGILRTYNAFGGVYYGAELAAISARCGIGLGRLIMIQLVYEVSAACTSVIHDFYGVPLLARNMDWELPGLDLRQLTVELEFVRQGQLVFKAASWAGCVGIFTGCAMGPHRGFAISVNYRVAGGTLWQNIKKGIGRGWPVSFLVREVLESAPNYATARSWLANSPVMYVHYSLFLSFLFLFLFFFCFLFFVFVVSEEKHCK
jgi:hypothetical protein